MTAEPTTGAAGEGDLHFCCVECQAQGVTVAHGDRQWAAQHQRETGHDRFAAVADQRGSRPLR